MKKTFTKFLAALMLLAIFTPSMIAVGQTTVATLSGTTTSGGTKDTNFADKTTYYQDGGNTAGDTRYLTIQNASAYWTTTPSSISFTATLGAGATRDPLGNNVYVALLDSEGNEISSTVTVVTTKITSKDGSDFTVSIPVVNNVYGVKIRHDKESSYNVRYYSFSLSYVAGGVTPTTYTVTFDAGDGTFVGNSDFPNTSNTVAAGTYTLPSATAPSGFTFNKWNIGAATYDAGDSYTVSDNADFVASYTQNGGGTTHTYNFAGANNFYTDAAHTTNPNSGSGNNVGTIYYGDGSTFVASGTNRYFSSASAGYFMLGKTDAAITLPTFAGYKITKVTLHSSTGHSTNVAVAIVSGSNTASAAQTWSTKDKDYVYDIAASYQSSALSVKVTNSYNTQFISITIETEAITGPTISANDVNIAYNANSGVINYEITNPVTGGAISASTEYSWITGFTYTQGATGTVTFTTSGANPYCFERPATVTLTYTYDNNQTETKSVAITQALNPNAPGTVNDPYTVAEARAAIEDNQGITGVYATGIVSAIPTPWDSDHNNITFNFVDNSGDTEFLQAYRCVSTANADASTVAVGDVVVVSGNLKKFGATYEFDAACQLVSLTKPAVALPTFSPAAGTYTAAQNVTISCTTANSTIYYTTDGSEPTSSSTQYNGAISVSTTTTIKAIAYVGTTSGPVATASYHFCSAENPYTVTQALAFLDYPANGIYVTGKVSTAPTQEPTNYGQLTYYISVDGTTANQLKVYKGKGLENAAFESQDDIQVGDIVTIYGNVDIYDNETEFAANNYLVSFERHYTIDVTGYGTSEGGYVLIASPVTEDITPSTENGFFTSETSEDFDLYRYNPTATGAEWENWKRTDSHYHYAIETGRGYLYASKTTTQLSFTGTLNTATDVELAYTGYNLIGNSSNATRYISGSYYIMNSNGTDIILSTRNDNSVNAMEGIVVNGTAGATVTFSTNAKRAENSRVILNIINSRGNVIDRAIVSFDENGNMPKFMIDETNTKIYFPQSEGNYAIVSSNGKGSMPVNFKAKEMGMYTISVETEGIDLSNLHLIDRLTGEDVNLLLDSKYSFIASSSDMESRFILSFGENGISANNETFAFQNGSDIIVNGEGELQVFDVMGRMVSNTIVNGVEAIALPQGVYIFRLNENIQKIVVR